MTKKDLSTKDMNAIVQFLLQNLTEKSMPKQGKMKEIAVQYNRSPRTIRRLWAAARKQKEEQQVIHLTSAKPNAARGKRVFLDLNLMQSLELNKRATIRKLADGNKCSPSTIGRWVKGGQIRAHTNAIKPNLTTPNKLLSLRFSLEQLEFDRILNIMKFKGMHNTIHIDEKWFYITRSSHRFYLTPGEAEPHRTCQNKSFIAKVMFMCAVSRPVFGSDGEVLFDGKIGIFSFTERVAALRTSKNRAKGTLETRAIQSITRPVIKDCLINKILPAVRAKWPPFASKHIFIQQDNAKPHIKDSDPDFKQAACIDGFDIRLVHQPPNSPDTNVNDLGWFRAIQSIQIESACYNVDELVKAVVCSFEDLSTQTLNKVFLSLQGCMLEIMRVKGQNCYKIPHMKKDQLIRQEALPNSLEVPQNLVEECIACIIDNGILEDISDLKNRLGSRGLMLQVDRTDYVFVI